MGSLSLLQGIFLIQESNRGLLHCRQLLYQLSYQGKSLTDRMDVHIKEEIGGLRTEKFGLVTVLLVAGMRSPPWGSFHEKVYWSVQSSCLRAHWLQAHRTRFSSDTWCAPLPASALLWSGLILRHILLSWWQEHPSISRLMLHLFSTRKYIPQGLPLDPLDPSFHSRLMPVARETGCSPVRAIAMYAICLYQGVTSRVRRGLTPPKAHGLRVGKEWACLKK